jgi:hypothetical protein
MTLSDTRRRQAEDRLSKLGETLRSENTDATITVALALLAIEHRLGELVDTLAAAGGRSSKTTPKAAPKASKA